MYIIGGLSKIYEYAKHSANLLKKHKIKAKPLLSSLKKAHKQQIHKSVSNNRVQHSNTIN